MNDPMFKYLEDNNNPYNFTVIGDPVRSTMAALNSTIKKGNGLTDPNVQEYLTAGVILYNWQGSEFIKAHKITEAEGKAMHTAVAVISRIRDAQAKSPHIRIHHLLNSTFGRSSW